MNHTPCPICRENHAQGRSLSYDGKGINSCGMYRNRIAKFQDHDIAEELGPKFAAAPAMYEALKGCLRVTEAWKSQAEMDGDTVEIEAAVMEIRRIKAALAQAEGGTHE